MINIAICDDEKEICSYLLSLIQKQNIACNITEYTSTEQYLTEKKEFDLLFLDIEMRNTGSDINGMELARRIRNNSGKQPIIIFVTGYEEYVYDAFDVKAFQYLLKPVDEKKFSEVMSRAVKSIQGKEKKVHALTVQYAGSTRKIPADTIYYIESSNHKIILHMLSGAIEYYAKLRDLEMELAGQFYRIHKGYLVNLSYIDEYTRNEVILQGGTRILISKYKYKEFVKAYLIFMEKEEWYEREMI